MNASPTIEVSEAVYRSFLTHVVRDGVFSTDERDRGGDRPPGDEQREAIAKGLRLDGRPPLLAALSGKGGWMQDRQAFKKQREPHINVSLIEHLASVVRGALVFGEIDLKAAGVSPAELPGRLAKLAAIAFLHDADKMLQQSREVELDPGEIRDLMRTYRIDGFLASAGQSLDAERMTALIDQVEVTRANRLRPGGPLLTRQEVADCGYVSLADRLDGIYLDTRKGINFVVTELKDFDNLRTDTLRSWRAAKITSPHTPFLLDELQRAFSVACVERHGHPPLIEVHHDGQLLLIAPHDGFDEVYNIALDQLDKTFKLPLRVVISARGTPDILDGGTGVADIRDHLQLNLDTARKALQISVDCVAPGGNSDHRQRIDDVFADYALAPQWPDFATHAGRFIAPWPVQRDDEMRRAFVADAATIAVTLACKAPVPALGLNVPNTAAREKELRALLDNNGIAVPPWLTALDHDISRRSLLAALAAAAASRNQLTCSQLLDEGGLVDRWLCGSAKRHGLLDKIESPAATLAEPVRKWFHAAAHGNVARTDENAHGRCHFTNAPVMRSARIDLSTGLYGLNVSAFSGREGRPESFESARSETLVSPLAQAEHRLRTLRARRRHARADVPILVSSPTTAGLFSSLAYRVNELPLEFSLADVLRVNKRNDDEPEFRDVDNNDRRYLIGRYESLPTRMASSGRNVGILSFVKMILEAARRMGRPLHVFRGLPQPNPAFVSFDFLPSYLVAALGGSSFRLEQLPSKIRLLRLVEGIASTGGLGVEIAARIADPQTRFGTGCEALAHFDRLDSGQRTAGHLRHLLLNLLEDDQTMPTKTDDAIIHFAEAMSQVQRAPRQSDGDTVAELGLRLALEAMENASRLRQESSRSFIAAVASSLDKEFGRKDLFSRRATRHGETLDAALENAARIFVEDVWPTAFRKRSPCTRLRRTALAIYRFTFKKAARATKAELNEPTPNASMEE